MTRCIQLVFVTLILLGPAVDYANAQETTDVAQAKADVEALLVRARQAAAEAKGNEFFDCLDPDGVFFGTDESERFSLAELKATFGPYFDQGIGWKRVVLERQVYVGPNNEIGWFEEKSRRERAPLRTTGVVRKTDQGWKIIQYNTALTIPNDIFAEVVERIDQNVETAPDQAPESVEFLSDEQRQLYFKSFDYAWEKVRDTYWDKTLGGVDWQLAYDELRPELDQAKTVHDAQAILEKLVQRMKVSHFGIIPRLAYEELGQSGEAGSRGGTTGLDVRIVDDQVLVVLVTPDSGAADVGVQTGWIVEVVDDIDVSQKLVEVKQEFEGNPHARAILASAANSRMRGRVGDEIKIMFRDENYQQQSKSIVLQPRRGEVVQYGNIPEFRVWVDRKQLDDDVGYFRFNAFMNPVQVMTAYNQFIKDNMDAAGIIIDVRGNGGGSGEIGMGMIGWLMPGEKASLGKVVLRDNELKLIVRPRPKTYQGPVVVLIDELSVSAAELFACGIDELTDGRLIGTRTAGAVLGSQIERLPTGDGFQYASANFISAQTGNTLEGIGVTPHETVEPDRETLLKGKDPAIQAGLAWIRSHDE